MIGKDPVNKGRDCAAKGRQARSYYMERISYRGGLLT